MLARSATIFKWTLYALAGLVWAAVQGAVLRRFSVFGVLPFLYPLLAAIPATLEGPAPGAVYALVWGVVCDLLLPSSLPCFYTLIFPLVGLAAGLLSKSLIPAGYRRLGPPGLSSYRRVPLHRPLGAGPRRLERRNVRYPPGAVRLSFVEPSDDMAVPPRLPSGPRGRLTFPLKPISEVSP